MTLGQKIRELREQSGMFQRELASKLEIGDGFLSTDYVKKTIAGLEIRSSAFLIDKYEGEMQERTKTHSEAALIIKDKIINKFSDVFEHPKKKHYLDILKSINEETIHITINIGHFDG